MLIKLYEFLNTDKNSKHFIHKVCVFYERHFILTFEFLLIRTILILNFIRKFDSTKTMDKNYKKMYIYYFTYKEIIKNTFFYTYF